MTWPKEDIEGLVEDHELGIEREGPAKGGAAALLLGRRGGAEVRHGLQAQLREDHVDASLDIVGLKVASEAERQADIVAERKILQQPVSGRKVADAPPEGELANA